MSKIIATTLVAAALGLTACAATPLRTGQSQVAEAQPQRWICTAFAQQMAVANAAYRLAADARSKSHNDDAVGAIFLNVSSQWLGGQNAHVAALQQRQDNVRRAASEKGCSAAIWPG
jgi:hypothetical protein